MLGDSLYLENLQEYVQDENTIVTYKWLSRKLEVPVDAAKRMLYAYVDHCHTSGQPEPSVVYTVTGILDGENGPQHQVCLVRKDELDDTKAQFSSVRSVHIYSVQQTNIKDSSTLFAADYDMCRCHSRSYSRWSPIQCTEPSKPHPQSGVTTSQPPPPPPPSSSSPLTTHTNTAHKQPSKASYKLPQLQGGGSGGGRGGGRRGERGGGGGRRGGGGGGRGGGGGGGRGDQHDQSAEKRKETENDEPGEAKHVPNAGKQRSKLSTKSSEHKKGGGRQKSAVKGSVASFFAKKQPQVLKESEDAKLSVQETLEDKPPSTHVPSSRATKNQSESTSTQPEAITADRAQVKEIRQRDEDRKPGKWLEGLNNSDIEDGSDSSDETPVVLKRKTNSKKESRQKKEKKPVVKAKPPEPERRKRRRIQNMSSDDDEEDTASVKRKVEPKTELPVPMKRRKKVKKLTSKMFTTEDGAMVTEKVWESVSEEESDPEEREGQGHSREAVRGGGVAGKVKSEQVSPSKGTKQASLMNFFKK